MILEVAVIVLEPHEPCPYDDGELTKEATIRNFRIVQMEGTRQVQRNIMHYNLQLIIAVCRASGSATYSYEHGGLVEEIRRISRV